MRYLCLLLLSLACLPARAQLTNGESDEILSMEDLLLPNTPNDGDRRVRVPSLSILDSATNPKVVPVYHCGVEAFGESAGVYLYDWSESKSFFFFEAKIAVDADGSPRAYHPQDKGIDKLEYAGRKGNWFALVTEGGTPIIQKADDPYPGYYVSKTATVYRGYPDNSPRRYIDAEKIPYFVLNPAVMRQTGAEKGDIGYVYNRRTKKGCFAIFGDVGSTQKIGEGSVYLAQQLGVNSNPRTGGQDGEIVYMVFPYSGNGAARSLKEINEIGARLMQKADGFSFIKDCLEGKK